MNAQISSALSLVQQSIAASGEGHGEVNWFVLISVIINFLVLFGAIVHYGRPALTRGLIARRTNMERGLKEAQEKQQEAEQKLQQLQYRLEHLEEEIQRIVRAYEAEAEADRQRMQRDTDRTIERLERETEFTIQQELRKAERLIKSAAVDATLRLAESMVQERMTGADQRRLTDQYIASLEPSAGA